MHAEDHSLFFVSDIRENTAVFSGDESHHMVSVLRAAPCAVIRATDGQGRLYRCSLEGFNAKAGEALVLETIVHEMPKPHVHAYVCMPERDPFEEVITNLTALGVMEITPVVSRFCQQKWWSNWDKYEERFHKKMVSALKQSMNVWMPRLTAPIPFVAAVEKTAGLVTIVADGSGKPCCDVLHSMTTDNQTGCFVGPPGGLAPDELETLVHGGAQCVSLGRTRLRTELAAVVLCSTVLQIHP